MTECYQTSLEFPSVKRRKVESDFSGGNISSNGGAMLLRQVDWQLDLCRRVARALGDGRRQASCEFSAEELIKQRVYGLALGYEDLNDHLKLRDDLVLQTAVSRDTTLASSATLPAFMSITEGKCHDIQAARNIELPRGSILVVDRGYNDYEWFNSLNKKGFFFVTRLKKNARYRVVKRKATHKKDGLTSDQEIILTSKKGSLYEGSLRRIGYICPETGRHYFFLTNNMKLAARTIAAIYKERWQIELFFKWIKQNLKIKSFVGTSKNTVFTQIWIAMCAYLLMAYLKFSSRITLAVSEMVRLLQLNLFDRRSLFDLLSPPDRPEPGECRQLAML